MYDTMMMITIIIIIIIIIIIFFVFFFHQIEKRNHKYVSFTDVHNQNDS